MAQETNSNINTEEIDPELEYLKKKTQQGTMNVLGDLLDNPEIKEVILKKVAVPLTIAVCFLLGILILFDVAKQLLGLNWQVETIISLILITIGLSYLAKNMFSVKKNDN